MNKFTINDLIKISEYEWEIPKEYRSDMRVPVRIFASKDLLEDSLQGKSILQAVNVCSLPGLVDAVMVMPDLHQGYGFPIGGVAVTDPDTGVISPGGIGYDINCGVRLMSSDIKLNKTKEWLFELGTRINQLCPSGVGVASPFRLTKQDLMDACIKGMHWAKAKGLATTEDIVFTEANGWLEGANPEKISRRAIERGQSQLGTLGGGNHFIEVDVVGEIYDQHAAEIMGLKKNRMAIQIHTGSRGFGHQICTDYVRKMQSAVRKYGILLPDKQLVCAPIKSPEGQDYLEAMRCGANYAFLNRQLLANHIRRAFEEVFVGKVENWHLNQVYDLAHNIGKFEKHIVNGKKKTVCVHRKGATRSFGPGTEGLPEKYQTIGQPVLVPGSMGTCSWVLTGTETSMTRSWGSSCHGAGRVMSRSQAKREIWGEDLFQRLKKKGIEVFAGSMSGLAEEAPEAYKNVEKVVNCVVGAKLARKVARLNPIIVIKG